MGQKKTGKSWEVRFWHQGKEIRKRGFSTKAEAVSAEAELRQQLKTETVTDSYLLLDLTNDYMDNVEKTQHKKTYQFKNHIYEALLPLIGDQAVNEITPYTIHKALDQSTDSATKYNTYRKAISPLFNWAVQMKIIKENPVNYIDKRNREVPFIKYIPPRQDIDLVILKASPHHKDVLLTAYYTLARRGEILGLIKDHIDFDQKIVTLWSRKRTGEWKSRKIRMVSQVEEILKVRYKNAPSNHLFWNPKTKQPWFDLNTLLPRLCKSLDIKPFGFHSLRHYGASFLAANGVPLIQIQQALGHSELRTTEVYLHELETVAEAVKILSDMDKTGHPNRTPAYKILK